MPIMESTLCKPAPNESSQWHLKLHSIISPALTLLILIHHNPPGQVQPAASLSVVSRTLGQINYLVQITQSVSSYGTRLGRSPAPISALLLHCLQIGTATIVCATHAAAEL